jgi:RimJ/RimL family protein N-acetyltransferase
MRVLEKAGFQFEGRLKGNAYKDGEILDQLLYAKLKR